MNHKKIVILINILLLILQSISLLFVVADSGSSSNVKYFFIDDDAIFYYATYDTIPYPIEVYIYPYEKERTYDITNFPDGAVFDSGVFSWKPACDQEGKYDIVVIAEKDRGLVEKHISIIVNDAC